MPKSSQQKSIVIFEQEPVRRIWVAKEEQWYFSIIDVVRILTESPTPRQYWGKVKNREFKQLQLSPIWVQLRLESDDGKKYLTDCANVAGIFRIIQSIPSKKAEPFKRWLAKVGYERLKEIVDPVIAINRARDNWKKLGRSEEWITQRMRGQEIRNKPQTLDGVLTPPQSGRGIHGLFLGCVFSLARYNKKDYFLVIPSLRLKIN